MDGGGERIGCDRDVCVREFIFYSFGVLCEIVNRLFVEKKKGWRYSNNNDYIIIIVK